MVIGTKIKRIKMINKGNILVIFLIATVVILSLAAAGYLFVQNRQLQNKKIESVLPVQNPVPTNNFPTPASVSTDLTANWKIYTNSDYSFSFKYPQSFSISVEKNNIGPYENFQKENILITRYSFKFTTGKIISGQSDWSGFDVDVFPTNGRTIGQEFKDQQGVGGKVGVRYIPKMGNIDEAADLTNIENGSRVYRLKDKFFEIGPFQNANTLPDKSDDVNQYLDQILSTFKFL